MDSIATLRKFHQEGLAAVTAVEEAGLELGRLQRLTTEAQRAVDLNNKKLGEQAAAIATGTATMAALTRDLADGEARLVDLIAQRAIIEAEIQRRAVLLEEMKARLGA